MDEVANQYIFVFTFEDDIFFPVEVLILVKNIDNEAENVVVATVLYK